jgi:hypothetical protein
MLATKIRRVSATMPSPLREDDDNDDNDAEIFEFLDWRAKKGHK